jgi:menaquinone-dependent protoporphyrinogen IX oxidase
MNMRVLIVYESMYGNTRVVASNVADGLRAGHDVILVPVGEATRELLSWADLVIVGGPTHMHRLSTDSSRKMAAQAAAGQASGLTLDPDALGPGLREWFDGIAPGLVLAAAFDTRINARSVFTGRASRQIRRLLKRHGYHVIAAPESFLVTSRSALLGGEAARARRWGAALGVIASDVKQPARTRAGSDSAGLI